MSQHDTLTQALLAYEKAMEGLFTHCLSNGVFNAWGAALDCRELNDARQQARAALSATQPAQAAQGEPTLRDCAEALVEAGHDFWKACNREAGGGAVRWLSCDDGTLIVFTRCEYRDVIMNNIGGYKAPLTVFAEDGMSAAEAQPAVAQGEVVGAEFFAYHPEMGVEFFKTQREAVACTSANLDYEREGAIDSGEWDDSEAESTCWGVVVQRAKAVQCGVSDEGVAHFDYVLSDTQPAAVAHAPLPEGWRLEDIGPQIHIHTPEGKWTAVGCETPYLALIHRFLADLLSCTQPAQPAAGADVLDAKRFTKDVPTEQGWYWHWNGDEECRPLPTSVLWSGTTNSCFVSRGQLGLSEAVYCDKYGGYWLKMTEPLEAIDAAIAASGRQE